MTAWIALLAWFALQRVGVALQLGGASHASSLAHLGGAGMGLVAWLVWRNQA